jgi:hypothetical protein
MKLVLFLIPLLLITACQGIDSKKAKKEFVAELNTISDPLKRQNAVLDVNSLCSNLGYLEDNNGKEEARKFRERIKMTSLQEKGSKALCPQCW